MRAWWSKRAAKSVAITLFGLFGETENGSERQSEDGCFSLVWRLRRSLLPSSRCSSLYEVQQPFDANWPVFPLKWFHFLRKVFSFPSITSNFLFSTHHFIHFNKKSTPNTLNYHNSALRSQIGLWVWSIYYIGLLGHREITEEGCSYLVLHKEGRKRRFLRDGLNYLL